MADELDDVTVSMYCEHCGNKSVFALRAEYRHTDQIENMGYSKVYATTIWSTMQCLNCLKPTVSQTYKTFSDDPLTKLPPPKLEILYPADKIPLPNLPPAIEKAYTAALK